MSEDLEISTGEAASMLHTTEKTVRSLLLSGELEGTSDPVVSGRHHQRLVLKNSVIAFIKLHGTYPAARARGHRKPSVADRVTALESLIRSDSLGKTTVGEMKLRELIRAQAQALTAMNEVVRLNESAMSHFRLAESDRSEAAKKLLDAQESLLDVVRLEGVPDDAEMAG